MVSISVCQSGPGRPPIAVYHRSPDTPRLGLALISCHWLVSTFHVFEKLVTTKVDECPRLRVTAAGEPSGLNLVGRIFPGQTGAY